MIKSFLNFIKISNNLEKIKKNLYLYQYLLFFLI